MIFTVTVEDTAVSPADHVREVEPTLTQREVIWNWNLQDGE